MKKHLILSFSLVVSILTGSLEAEESSRMGLVIGTRPEAIKVIPLYLEMVSRGVEADIIFTGQHKDMAKDIFEIFKVTPSYDLDVMKPGQDLFYLTNTILEKTKQLFETRKYTCVIVQGDTTSAYASALSAFYLQIPVIHLEAGLRSHNTFRPFPEEGYRQMISRIASLHLAPTSMSYDNLIKEGIDKRRIEIVGNTVTDALRLMNHKVVNQELRPSQFLSDFFLKASKQKLKTILLTVHRRESLQNGIQEVFKAVKQILSENKDICIIYPMHPNPQIKKIFDSVFPKTLKNLIVCNPLIYHDLTYVLQNIDWVLTDSGGIQEEAVSLNKPTLVLREETDRPEALVEQKALLVGTQKHLIQNGMTWLKNQPKSNTSAPAHIYGDGFAAGKSCDAILHFINSKRESKL